jgi:hypothetical protein
MKDYFGYWIQSQNYILMITTTYCCSEGPYSILVTGTENVTFY